MTTTNIKLPYLDDTGLDGKKLYTPKEWTEIFRHYTIRINNVDTKQILTEDTVPTGDTAIRGIQKNQKSDKTLSGAQDRQR